MRSRASWVMALGLVVPWSGMRAETGADERTPEAWVEALGSEDYPEREKATAALWAMGEPVADLLAEAAVSANPEVAERASDVLRRIELEISPDSPREVVDLVLRYDTSTAPERQAIVRRLKELRAWRQVLRLHALEQDAETLRLIAREMAGVAMEAAREMLAGDEPDPATAREVLEMARPDLPALLALADFHRANGTLRAELERVKALGGADGARRRLALHLIAGDEEATLREADAAGEVELAARLRALTGDPLPWVESEGLGTGDVPAFILEPYREAVRAKWLGRPLDEERAVRKLVQAVGRELDDQGWHAMGALFALGATKEAELAYSELNPLMAFTYFNTQERVDEALAVLGLDASLEFQDWCDERFDRVIEDEARDGTEVSELATLGGFLEARGMRDELRRCFIGPLVGLSRADPERFLEVVQEMFGGYDPPLVTPLIEAGAIYAGDSDVRWAALRNAFFGEGVHVEPLWRALGDYQPGAAEVERLELMVRLLGVLPDPEGEAAAWWEWAGKWVEKAAPREKPGRYGLLLTMSALRPDAARFLKLGEEVEKEGLGWDDLGEFSESLRFDGYRMVCLGAVGRWGEVAEWREGQVAERPWEPLLRALWAAALREAGEVERARAEEAMLEKLVLGEARVMMQVAEAYATVGDFPRERGWRQRAAWASTADAQMFRYAAMNLGDAATEATEWGTAASVKEVELFLRVLGGDSLQNPVSLVRKRAELGMARGLDLLKKDRKRALGWMEASQDAAMKTGAMADFFLPVLREAGLEAEHDAWLGAGLEFYERVLARFPESYNTLNSTAWTVARGNRRLQDAERWVSRALELMPGQAAYLDTLAEVWFCRRNRGKAVEWSATAVKRAPGDGMLMRQFRRFESGSFPPR